MELQPMPTGITNHAALRIVERTGLGPRTAKQMLEDDQFFWACTPRAGKPRYALLFDSCTNSHVVAVLAPDTKTVVTFLTLEQYESSTGCPVAAIRLGLARLALLRQSREAQVLAAESKPAAAPQWQFSLVLHDGTRRELATMAHDEVCTKFLFVLPPVCRDSFTRRCKRIARSRHFAEWFMSAIPADVDPSSVESAWAAALDPLTGEELWMFNVTKALQAALSAPENDRTVQRRLRFTEKQGMRIAKRERELLRRADIGRGRVSQVASTELVLCV